MRISLPSLAALAFPPLLLVAHASAGLVSYVNDKPGWLAATGASTAIGFADLPTGTIVTDQYAALGLTLADGDDFVTHAIPGVFPVDGAGLVGGPSITLDFGAPVSWVAFEFPGLIQAEFFFGDSLVFTSGPLNPPVGSTAGFAGFLTTAPIDRVTLKNWAGGPGNVFLDTIYFQPVPVPACTLLPLAALMAARRRRRG